MTDSYTFDNNVAALLTVEALSDAVALTVQAATNANPPPDVLSGKAVVSLMDRAYQPTQFEIVTYTGRTDNGNGTYTLTGVVRAQENTTAQLWPVGTVVVQAITADAYQTVAAGAGVLFLDGGDASTNYGGINAVDGGDVNGN